MHAHEAINVDQHADLQALLALLEERKEAFVAQTSTGEYDQVARHLTVISQWIAANITDKLPTELPAGLPRKHALNNFARSMYMADNLAHVIEGDGRKTKLVVWAHTFHLAVGFDDRVLGAMPNMGQLLRERFGDQYYMLCFESGSGAYLAREWLPDDTLGDLRVASIPPVPDGSFHCLLAQLGRPVLLLDLREPIESPVVDAWLSTPQFMHMISWAYREPALHAQMNVRRSCDGIIFIKETSATTPTVNARRVVAERVGH